MTPPRYDPAIVREVMAANAPKLLATLSLVQNAIANPVRKA